MATGITRPSVRIVRAGGERLFRSDRGELHFDYGGHLGGKSRQARLTPPCMGRDLL